MSLPSILGCLWNTSRIVVLCLETDVPSRLPYHIYQEGSLLFPLLTVTQDTFSPKNERCLISCPGICPQGLRIQPLSAAQL